MPARRLSRLGVAVLCFGAVLVLDRPVPSHAAAAQAVTAPGGLMAHGYVPDARFGDATRWLSVMLVVPAEPVVSSGAADAVDLARPWAVMTSTSVDTGGHVCGRVENSVAFNPGHLTPAGGGGEAWRNTSVDIACDDGAGYLFYRVHWDPGSHWLVRNPLALEYSGGHLTRWSAPPMRGVVETVPLAIQQTGLTICGHRSATSQPGPGDCFGAGGAGSGFGTVVPTTERLTAQAAAIPI